MSSRTVSTLPPGFSQSLYTDAAYLAAQGIESVLAAVDENADDEILPYALFADCGAHLMHLGRLTRYDDGTIARLSEAVFVMTNAEFILFEDIERQDCSTAGMRPCVRYAYHDNWHLPIAPGPPPMSGSQRRRMASKMRNLRVNAGGREVRFEFGRSDPGCIDRIVAFNRSKAHRQGRKHHLCAVQQARLHALCAEIGYCATLHCGDDLIAGDVLCISGNKAYFLVIGYDGAYRKFSPGMQTHYFAWERLAEMRCGEANFLWGNGPWQERIGARRQPLVTIVVARDRRVMATPGFWRVSGGYAVLALKASVRHMVPARLRGLVRPTGYPRDRS